MWGFRVILERIPPDKYVKLDQSKNPFDRIHNCQILQYSRIDPKTGETTQVDFPADAGIGKLEQINIDSLGINVIFVSARNVDLDGKNGIDWNDPTQIIILSPDGKQKKQLTDDKFFARTWAVNKLTGTIVITGHYDTNNNGKYDKTDKNEIHIFDLKTFKAVNII